MFDSFLLQGFRLLPKKTISINSVDVSGVWNGARHNDGKSSGGFEPSDIASFQFETSLIPNAKSLVNKRITIDSVSWRVSEINHGQWISTATLISSDQS